MTLARALSNVAGLLFALALVAPLSHAAAQAEPADAPAQGPAASAPAATATTEPQRVWVFSDGVGTREVPWEDYDPDVHYAPRGLLHVGVQLRVGALPRGDTSTGVGPFVDAVLFVDKRFASTSSWRFRAALVVSAAPPTESRRGSGNVEWSSPFGVRFRVFPFAVDFGRYLTWRIAGDIGIQYAPLTGGRGQWVAFPAWSGELAARLMDGLLEVGVTAGMQWTALGESDRRGDSVDLTPEAVVGGFVSWVFP